MISPSPWLEPLDLSEAELVAIVNLVYERSGIALHDGKQSLIVARLQKRMRLGGFRTFADYLKFVEEDETGEELVGLLDAIATNHTSFFREDEHFGILAQQVLPPLLAERGREISVWSAACSTGEEPISLAITILEEIRSRHSDASLEIVASDISTRALGVARGGVYPLEKTANIPLERLRRWFEKGLGEQEGLARVRPEVRRLIDYRRENLIEINSLGRAFDIIFCRNVMIYFDRPTQQRVVSMLERHLAPGGYLFISHSESVHALSHGFSWVAPAVYRRKEGAK